MRIQTRLNVIVDRVLCPRTCAWEMVDHCVQCAELARLEQRDREWVVVCRPDIEGGLSRTVERLTRA